MTSDQAIQAMTSEMASTISGGIFTDLNTLIMGLLSVVIIVLGFDLLMEVAGFQSFSTTFDNFKKNQRFKQRYADEQDEKEYQIFKSKLMNQRK